MKTRATNRLNFICRLMLIFFFPETFSAYVTFDSACVHAVDVLNLRSGVCKLSTKLFFLKRYVFVVFALVSRSVCIEIVR